ncbi:hypothetical protein J4456_00100 [Candidatus Pacearchaeota archaeon]|nr:hypothetical protein [Candidatus Pacearchaeota archaeon]
MEVPLKKKCRLFIEKFGDDLQKYHPDVCFYTFGSVNSEYFDEGRSDIDGV